MIKNYNLKTRLAIALTCLVMAFSINVNAQLTGVKNIPGDYATLALAITDLNTQGVGAGGVTLNMIAGNPESAPAGGYSITTLTGTAANPIIIQGNGNTITASNAQIVGALNDAIFKIIGADYVTITGFTMQEDAANTVTALATNNMTEWGIALLYATTTNGSQNITIQGNAISLNRTYPNTFGIYSNSTHSATSVTASATATTSAGANNSLIIYANAISNVNMGIVVVGPTAAADNNDGLDIGGVAGVTGNTITNFGTTGTFSGYANVSGTVNGILIRNTKNFNVSYNSIASSVGGTTSGTLRGIFVPAFSNAPTGTITNTIGNNSISLQSGVNAAMQGVFVDVTTATATSTINIVGNNFQNTSYSIAGASSAITFISSGVPVQALNVTGNLFTNLSVNTTGSVTFIAHPYAMASGATQTFSGNSIVTAFNKTVAGGTVTFTSSNSTSTAGSTSTYNNNNFSNVTLTGATTLTVFNNTDGGTGSTKIVTNNTISNITAGTSAVIGMNFTYWNGVSNMSNNTINSIAGQSSITGINIGSAANNATSINVGPNTIFGLVSTGTGGAVAGINCSNTSTNIYINGNTIYTLSSTGASAVNGIAVTGATSTLVFKNKIYDLQSNNAGGSVNGILTSSGTLVNVYNNLVGDLKAPIASATNPVIGINVSGGTAMNVYYNTVRLNATSSGTNFGSSAVSASSTPTVTLRNNILINNSTPMGTGLAVAYRRSSTTLTSYANTSNNNIFYAGAASASNLIFYDGTNSDQTFAAFQTRVGPTRDAASRTENVAFTSTAGASASFLHVNTATPTFAESGASNIGGYTDDFDGDIRQGNGGYAGTGTAPDIGADEFEGTPVPMCAGIPAAGSITGAAAVCTGTGTTLSLTGATNAVGISYQWASSAIAGGPYTNMGTNVSQATGNLTAPSYYIVIVTCSFSGLSDTTNEYTLGINANPTVLVSPPSSTYCSPGGTAVALTASAANTYSWAPATGLSSTTGTSVNASPAAATTYTVTGTDINGCIGTATAAVTVTEIPTVSSVTATPSSVCSGGSSQLVATAALTPNYNVSSITYAATTDPGGVSIATGDDGISGAVTIPFSFTFYGVSYTQLFAYTNGFVQLGASSGSTTTYGQLLPSATAPNNIIAGVFSDLNVSGAAAIRAYTTGVSPNRIFTIHYNNVPFYTTAAGNVTGNTDWQIQLYETSNIIEVHIGDVTGLSTTTANKTLGIEKVGGTAAVTPAGRNFVPWTVAPASPEAWRFAPVIPAFTYSWSPAATLSSSTIANPMANGITAPTTTYTVTVSNGGCSATGSVIVTAGSALSATSNISPASSVCTGTTVTLNSIPAGGGAPYTYAWNGPAGFTSASQNPTFAATAATAGTYTIVVTDNCAATTTSTVTLTVNGLPTIAVSPTSAVYCNPGTAVALTASGTSTGYAWLPAAGLSATSGASVNASPAGNTTYTVTGTDGNGCMNTATASISSSPAVTVSSVTASPNTVCSGSSSNLLASASLVNSTYCAAGATNTGFEKISNVTFGTINNTSSATAGYENFTAMSSNVTAGVSMPISMGISLAYATDDRVHIWVDMNNDGVFADPSENVLNLAISTFCPTCSGTNTTVNGNITIPVTAFNGSTRMRIRMEDQSSGGNLTPCGTSTYGQVEDYTINISGGTDNGITYSWLPSTYLSSTTISNPVASAIMSNVTYTVTASSLAGCSATGTAGITVNAIPSAPAVTGVTTICSGNSASLSTTGVGTIGWYNAATGGTHIGSGSSFVSPVLTANATYYVQDSSASGCVSPRTSVTVTVNPLPTIMAMSTASTVCAGTSVTLEGMGASTYSWTGGVTDGLAFTPTATNTYTVTGTDGNGCSNTATTTVTVNPLPTVMAMTTANTVCAGTSVTLEGMGASTYSWTGGVMDGVAFTPTATDTYTLSGTDANGCSNTATTTVTVNPLPVVTASSDATANTVCAGTMVTLTGGGAATLSWDNSVVDGDPFTPMTTMTYIVTGTDANSCSNTASITITVNSVTVDLGADTTQCGGTIALDAMNAGDDYTWSDLSTGQTLNVSSTGTYSVTVTDPLTGCSDSDMIDVTINPLPSVSMAQFTLPICDNAGAITLANGSPSGGVYSGTGVSGGMFDPATLGGMYLITYTVTDGTTLCSNADTASITVDICSGIIASTSDFNEITVYPNPASETIYISVGNTNFSQLTVSIVDIQGKEVYNEKNTNVTAGYNKQINIEKFAKGVYYIKLNTGNDSKVQKLIVH